MSIPLYNIQSTDQGLLNRAKVKVIQLLSKKFSNDVLLQDIDITDGKANETASDFILQLQNLLSQIDKLALLPTIYSVAANAPPNSVVMNFQSTSTFDTFISTLTQIDTKLNSLVSDYNSFSRSINYVSAQNINDINRLLEQLKNKFDNIFTSITSPPPAPPLPTPPTPPAPPAPPTSAPTPPAPPAPPSTTETETQTPAPPAPPATTETATQTARQNFINTASQVARDLIQVSSQKIQARPKTYVKKVQANVRNVANQASQATEQLKQLKEQSIQFSPIIGSQETQTIQELAESAIQATQQLADNATQAIPILSTIETSVQTTALQNQAREIQTEIREYAENAIQATQQLQDTAMQFIPETTAIETQTPAPPTTTETAMQFTTPSTTIQTQTPPPVEDERIKRARELIKQRQEELARQQAKPATTETAMQFTPTTTEVGTQFRPFTTASPDLILDTLQRREREERQKYLKKKKEENDDFKTLGEKMKKMRERTSELKKEKEKDELEKTMSSASPEIVNRVENMYNEGFIEMFDYIRDRNYLKSVLSKAIKSLPPKDSSLSKKQQTDKDIRFIADYVNDMTGEISKRLETMSMTPLSPSTPIKTKTEQLEEPSTPETPMGVVSPMAQPTEEDVGETVDETAILMDTADDLIKNELSADELDRYEDLKKYYLFDDILVYMVNELSDIKDYSSSDLFIKAIQSLPELPRMAPSEATAPEDAKAIMARLKLLKEAPDTIFLPEPPTEGRSKKAKEIINSFGFRTIGDYRNAYRQQQAKINEMRGSGMELEGGAFTRQVWGTINNIPFTDLNKNALIKDILNNISNTIDLLNDRINADIQKYNDSTTQDNVQRMVAVDALQPQSQLRGGRRCYSVQDSRNREIPMYI